MANVVFCSDHCTDTTGPFKFCKYLKEEHVHFPFSLLFVHPRSQESSWYKYFPLALGISNAKKYQQSIQASDKAPDLIIFNYPLHACLVSLPTDKTIAFMHDDNTLVPKLVNTRNPLIYISRQLEHLIQRITFRNHVRHFIVNSEYLKKLLINTYKIDQSKVSILYKGIYLHQIKIRPFRRHFPDPIRILFVKNDFRRGGLFDLISALGTIGNKTFRLTVVGPPKIYEKTVSRKCTPYQNIYLNFIGPQREEQVYKYMQSEDLLIIPSRAESLGVSMIEGLAHGIPVVTTNVGGIPEVMDQGNNGWLSRAKDPEHLASIILSCLEQPDRRKEKIIAGRKFVQKHFDISSTLSRFTEIVNHCLQMS